ncbi:MAG: Sua5/YciO/YrdC/YwlC family protein, partial [Calditrichaeota bacterium]
MPVEIRIDPRAPEKGLLVQAAEVLRKGGVVLHPTETVYGLAARWDSEAALEKVSRIKGRPPQQPYSIMVHQADTIPELLGWQSALLEGLVKAFFPGPVTLLLPRRKTLAPEYWNRFSYLGFRMPEHRLSRELIRLTGTPLITT